MNILAIDTSTKNLSLAVAKNEKILRYRNTKLQRPLSSSIMPSIQGILKEAGAKHVGVLTIAIAN
jgi:tRNA A37 threonylcarbamoyladenosine modification protein TsaB